jgi:hypothetical protein
VSDVAPFVRAAFANGYAETGPLPVPDSARLASLVAIEVAEEYSEDPNIVHAVTEAGRREGRKQTFEARFRANEARFDAETRKLCARVATAATTKALKPVLDAALAVTESTVRERRTEAAKVAAATVIAGLIRNDSVLEADFSALAVEAHIVASAEGLTTAQALIAVQDGHAMPDLDALYDRTLAALRDLGSIWDAESWVSAQIQGLAGDLGKALAAEIDAGSSREQLLGVVRQALETGDGAAFYLDNAIHAAMSSAMLGQYVATGTLVDYVTEGDASVCPTCEDYSIGSPYDPGTCPSPPVHGNCRCWTAPSGTVS